METINTGITPNPEVKTPVNPILKSLNPYIEKSRKQGEILFKKMYANKMIFWPVTIVGGLLLLTIVVGLLFGTTRNNVAQIKKTTPTPISKIATPQATTSADILTTTQNHLNDLKVQINSLDVQQSRLQPPTINFNVKF